jgi:hypothetical protein
MKNILFALLFLSSFNACAFDEWSDADVKREAVYLAFHAMDWAQTRNIARNPDKYEESGIVARQVIGAHPSIAQVDAYIIGSAIAQYAIAQALPTEYRTIFQYVTIGDAANSVVGNFRIGLKIQF